MFLLTVKDVKQEFRQCRELVQKGTPEEVLDAIKHFLPECLRGDGTLASRMVRAVQLREIDLLLGRNMGDEIEFVIPKSILDEETEKELHRGGWDTGHWFRDIRNGGELKVVISSNGYNHH